VPNEEVAAFLRPLGVERAGLEASTHIAPLYRCLVKEGHGFLVSHTKKTRYITEAHIKSDKVDSRALEELVRLDSLPLSYMPPRDIAELHKRVRRRAFRQERNKLMVKTRGAPAYEGIKPPEDHGLFTRRGMEWLQGLRIDSVSCYLRVMAALKAEVQRLSLELRSMAAGDEGVRLLMTIPGVGYNIALLVKAEIGDIGRFGSGDQLASYAGLAPSTYSSGCVTRHGRITREGSNWLRWAIVDAVHTHLKKDTPVTRAYHRTAERRGRLAAKVILIVSVAPENKP